MSSIELFPVFGIPLINPGDSLAKIIMTQLHQMGKELQANDIIVIAQKVVSKIEGRLLALDSIQPTEQAEELAAIVDKDPRIVQAILDDSNTIIRSRRGLLVAEQQAGWICANAGVDRSNVEQGADGEEYIALLPINGDVSAERIREELKSISGIAPAVLINDSHGRPWRVGTVGVCIGCAGLAPIWNQRGLHDLFGYELHSSEECIADELAAAASLLMGQSNEGQPIIIIRGYQTPPQLPPAPAQTIQRAAETDAFR